MLFIYHKYMIQRQEEEKKGGGGNFPLKSLQEKSTECCYERDIHQKESTIGYA